MTLKARLPAALSLPGQIARLHAARLLRASTWFPHVPLAILVGATGLLPLAKDAARALAARGLQTTAVLSEKPDAASGQPGDFVVGDGSDTETLRSVHAADARAVLALSEDDSYNAFVVLAAKELNPAVRTVAAVSDTRNTGRVARTRPDVLHDPEHSMPSLFDPLKVGDLLLPNRVIMAPLTRSRAGASRRPNALMAEYYAQRASAGLILSEATVVTSMGIGYADTPGIWSSDQVAGWKQITQAVHAAGGRMFLQLWHVGRVSHPTFLDGNLPVAPSAVAPIGNVSLLRPATPFVTPRALARSEIPEIVAAFARGAQNAELAGFDGVELHGANGYLLDQFLQDSTNHRDDDYGGPVENRARLLLEVADAAISVWGPGRVGVHLAPRGDSHSMGDSNRAATFGHVARELASRRIAFLCAREHVGPDSIGPQLKSAFGGVYIANEKFTRESAEEALAAGRADAVAFGKLFLANPDLPARLLTGAALNTPHTDTFYRGGASGYTDYPALDAASG